MDPRFTLSFGAFGPCRLDAPDAVGGATVDCPARQSTERQWITLEFYRPGNWTTEPITVESIARRFAALERLDSSSPLERAFTLTNPASRAREFYLAGTLVDSWNMAADAFIVKVGLVRDTVYSLWYGRAFDGDPDSARRLASQWLSVNLPAYALALSNIAPDPSWVEFIEHTPNDGARN